MDIIWLGQAGLLFDNADIRIIIDPYLSDSVERIDSEKFRRVPVNEEFFDAKPDVLIFTHDHLDHYDPETFEKIIAKSEKPICVLSPRSVWNKVRAFGGGHNYILFDRFTEWTERGICFSAVRAKHSDPDAIGVIIDDLKEKKKYYITGDTLFSPEIFSDIPKDVHALFLPINGVGNNMNVVDALRFSKIVGAQNTVPLHFGLLDGMNAEGFEAESRVIPEIYNKINIKD